MLFGGRERRPKPQPGITTRAPVEIETVIGPNTSLQGDLHSSGGVRLDGDFSGTIEIAGNLVIGEQAQVIATITAHNVQIQGTVQGDITAKRVEILDTGKLWGDVVVDSFVLDDGGFYHGQSTMHSDAPPPLLKASNTAQNEIVDVEPTITETNI